MKAECPNVNCRSKEMKKIVSSNDGSDNIDNLPHYDVECVECGRRFLEWGCELEKVKKAFGENWSFYV